jgi:polysaccharide biosynthesis transport protein
MEKTNTRPTPSLNGTLPTAPVPSMLPMPMPLADIPSDEWNLQQVMAVVRRRAWAIASVAALVMSVVVPSTFSQEAVYQGQFRLLVEPVNANDDFENITSNLNAQPQNYYSSGLDYETQIQVLQSPQLLSDVVQRLQTVYPDLDYGYLAGGISINRLGETKILEVRYQSTNPKEIQIILQQLSKTYLSYSLTERQTNLRQGIQFIDAQLPSSQDRVDQLQRELQNFRQRFDFIDPDMQASQISGQDGSLKGQRIAIDQELAKARAHFSNLQGETGAIAALNSAELYQQLLGELRQVESKIAEELTRFREGSLSIQTLRQRRANLLPLLQQEAQRVVGSEVAEAISQIQILEVQSQTLAQAESRLLQQTQQLPVLSRQYADLQRELQVATESLSRFLTTRETLQIQAAQTEIPWQLIEAPEASNTPVSPNIRRSLILGLITSTLLGLGVAFLLERLDNVYYSIEDLKDKTRLPLLGKIPFNRQLASGEATLMDFLDIAGLPFRAMPRMMVPLPQSAGQDASGMSEFAESLRVLRTNIHLLSSDQPMRSLVVTSALPGDGKSTLAIHLAQAATAMGQRVLLVDADLRHSQLHNQLGLDNFQGLSNLISAEVQIEEVLQQPQPSAEFFVITAGQIPPDPTKLLSSQKMYQLMEDFKSKFDLVIYDTPFLAGLADASLLAANSNGIILVVRLGKTNCSSLSQVLENLRLSQIPILGVVANAVRSSAVRSRAIIKRA